jgi:hypothetical protein
MIRGVRLVAARDFCESRDHISQCLAFAFHISDAAIIQLSSYYLINNKKPCIDIITSSTTQQQSTIGRSTIIFHQLDNPLQDQISFQGGRPDRKRLGNKAEDVLVNTIPAARSDMRPHNHQSRVFCHVTTSCPENAVQDHGEVYYVPHHTSNIFLADMQETEQPVGDTSRYSLTCLDKYRKPNPRACLGIHSSRYRQFNSLDVFIYCAIHLPRRCATSWYGRIFDHVGHIYFELVA